MYRSQTIFGVVAALLLQTIAFDQYIVIHYRSLYLIYYYLFQQSITAQLFSHALFYPRRLFGYTIFCRALLFLFCAEFYAFFEQRHFVQRLNVIEPMMGGKIQSDFFYLSPVKTLFTMLVMLNTITGHSRVLFRVHTWTYNDLYRRSWFDDNSNS
jgi:hypothetical protein